MEKARSDVEVAIEEISMCKHLPISEVTLQKIKQATKNDSTMEMLISVVKAGWPESKRHVPDEIVDYFTFREELSVQDGLVIFKGHRLVIPQSLRSEIQARLHSSHLGIQSCLRRARESVYWPRMCQDLTDYITKCSICNQFQPEQQKEPMISHNIPTRAWEQVGCDLFELKGKQYLVCVDYFSDYYEIDRMKQTTSDDVIY